MADDLKSAFAVIEGKLIERRVPFALPSLEELQEKWEPQF
jgi:hypothetical protein